jgi:hypothetical protein
MGPDADVIIGGAYTTPQLLPITMGLIVALRSILETPMLD